MQNFDLFPRLILMSKKKPFSPERKLPNQGLSFSKIIISLEFLFSAIILITLHLRNE